MLVDSLPVVILRKEAVSILHSCVSWFDFRILILLIQFNTSDFLFLIK
jgi:hypothetical protein